MNRITLARIAMASLAALSIPLPAQTGAVRPQTGPAFLVSAVGLETPMVVDASTIPVLRKRVSLRLSRVTVEEALKSLSTKSGIQLSYSRQYVPLANRVTLDASNITVAAALTEILFDAGVDVVFSSSDRASLVRRAPQSPPVVGSLTGKVIDAATRRPIGSATIQLDRELPMGRTREDGTFQITQITAGSHVLHVRMIGYASTSRRVEIGENATATVEILLEKSAQPLDQVVVTGPMTPTEMKAIPNAMTVITGADIERRGITSIEQLFRGEVAGLFAVNPGSSAILDEVLMFSRGATALSGSAGTANNTNPIKTYVDGVELANPTYLSQIDPRTIERIEIIPGPQASTTYGSNAINGVMQIFTKRGTPGRPRLRLGAMSGIVQNNLSDALSPTNSGDVRVSGSRSLFQYDASGSVDHMGPWTPAKKTTRYNASAGLRMTAGRLIADLTARAGHTTNLQHGDIRQVQTSWRETGLVQPNGSAGLSDPTTSAIDGQTAGLTLNYTPFAWWSHEAEVGVDLTDLEQRGIEPGFITVFDTLVSYTRSKMRRSSERYVTTARLPIRNLAEATITLGADHWDTKSSLRTGAGLNIASAIDSSVLTKDKPGKNSGGFLQAQLGFRNQLFLTYGLRAEWNQNYGDDAQPNLAPRFGAAVTRAFLGVTAKARASYGRATRPPASKIKSDQPETNPTNITLYGNYISIKGNTLLEPEFQEGAEGGLELYFGTRASVTVTRYNQTVENLISRVSPVDSVRSLAPGPQFADRIDADGFGYVYIGQNLNVGTIRNDGWEAQGTLRVRAFTTRAVYSWTRSRIIGVTPQYRSMLGSSVVFQVGRSFDYLPEHTWAITETFSTPRTSIALAVNGHGQIYKGRDFVFASATTNWRDPYYKLRQNLLSTYRSLGKAHAFADINATHRFTPAFEGIVQVRNIANSYDQDMDVALATLGRQSKIGVRVNF